MPSWQGQPAEETVKGQEGSMTESDSSYGSLKPSIQEIHFSLLASCPIREGGPKMQTRISVQQYFHLSFPNHTYLTLFRAKAWISQLTVCVQDKQYSNHATMH